MDALTIQSLALTRGERRLFSGLDLALNAGQALALTGANGAGKTSLLRAIAGFIAPDDGAVRFIQGGSEKEAETARREDVHLLGQIGRAHV